MGSIELLNICWLLYSQKLKSREMTGMQSMMRKFYWVIFVVNFGGSL
jgi:hypothetical protein